MQQTTDSTLKPDHPFFSVGIPAWKSLFLKETIESVLQQGFANFELIIVDDASPYRVAEVVQSFHDGRIRYFRNERNFGARDLVDNWNTCLEHARGRYFLLLGDDDRLEPDCLEEFASLIKMYPDLNVYHCRARLINEQSELIGFTESRPGFESVYEAIWHRIKGFRTQFVSDFMYDCRALKKAGGYFKLPMGWVSDDITSYRAMIGKGIAHTQKPVFSYRYSSLTMSNSGSVFLKLEAIQGEKRWLEDFLNHQPSSDEEKVIRRNIQELLPRYFQKKQIATMAMWATNAEFCQLARLRKTGTGGRQLLMALVLKCRYSLTGRFIN